MWCHHGGVLISTYGNVYGVKQYSGEDISRSSQSVSQDVLIRASKIRFLIFFRFFPPSFHLEDSVGATISLGFECFSILIRVSKIRFSFFFPIFFLPLLAQTIGYELVVSSDYCHAQYVRTYMSCRRVRTRTAVCYVSLHQEEFPPHICHFMSCSL